MESDFAILTPSATLSVRGTRGIKCRFFADEGGTYGLADKGLIAIIDGMTGREAACRPGQSTNDRATKASKHLANRHMPIALDNAGQEKKEKVASQRRRSGLAAAPGLGNAGGRAANRAAEICINDRVAGASSVNVVELINSLGLTLPPQSNPGGPGHPLGGPPGQD